MMFTSRNWFVMQGSVAIILISWNVIFIWETGYWTRPGFLEKKIKSVLKFLLRFKEISQLRFFKNFISRNKLRKNSTEFEFENNSYVRKETPLTSGTKISSAKNSVQNGKCKKEAELVGEGKVNEFWLKFVSRNPGQVSIFKMWLDI